MNFFRRFQSTLQPAPANALSSDALAALGQLELIARGMVDGLLSGKHRSTHRGGTNEFAEYREYSTGDDVRRIDWRLHARNDRYHIRTYEDETNLRALLVVDASGSMAYQGSTAAKFDVGRVAAACLARLLMKQRDSVGLAVVAETTEVTARTEIPAGLRPSTLSRINQTLAEASIAGEGDVADSLMALRPTSRRRGMMILISDCFGEPEALRRSLSAWTAAGHDCCVIETLAPEEVEFSFRGSVVFEDLELSDSRIEIDAGQVRRLYLDRIGRHREAVAEAITRSRADHLTLMTDASLEETLRQFLIHRRAKLRARRGGNHR